MHADCTRKCRPECPHNLVCRCLEVTEAALLQALDAVDPQTLEEVRRLTGAGTGCLACHKLVKRYLERRQKPAGGESLAYALAGVA